jgi:hypothetical protein
VSGLFFCSFGNTASYRSGLWELMVESYSFEVIAVKYGFFVGINEGENFSPFIAYRNSLSRIMIILK